MLLSFRVILTALDTKPGLYLYNILLCRKVVNWVFFHTNFVENRTELLHVRYTGAHILVKLPPIEDRRPWYTISYHVLDHKVGYGTSVPPSQNW